LGYWSDRRRKPESESDNLLESTNNNITMNNNIDRAESPDVSPPGYVNILPEITEQPQQPYDEDDHSGEIREYNGVFEGPEKTLEVVFRKLPGFEGNLTDDESSISDSSLTSNGSGTIHRKGLRTLSRADLDRICARARCTILSSVSNRYLDAYVLSESSLFVYPYMIVLKTCGTTTLLRCVATLIELGRKIGLEIDWMGYNRKNFNFPGDQMFPHGSFNQEMDYLYSHRNLCERLNGNGYTLGPVTSDHWFVFVADHTKRYVEDNDTDRVLNIMMFDIDQTVAQKFYYDKYQARISDDETEEKATKRISMEQTKAAGIDNLVAGATIDPRAFEPCGYSMNAILFHSYSTMHITPEEGSSYASFETNQKLSSYTPLIAHVVRAFRPKRFVMTLMADEGGLVQMGSNPLFEGSASKAKINVPLKGVSRDSMTSLSSLGTQSHATYKRSNLASIKVEDDTCCMMGNWVLEENLDADCASSSDSSSYNQRARGLSVSNYCR
jgi:S-adenosylmethionine decarboxylase